MTEKDRRKVYDARYRQKNRARIRRRVRLWKLANPEKVKRWNRIHHASYYQKHRARFLEHARTKYRNDPAKAKRYQRRYRERVTMAYARGVLCCATRLKARDLPEALVQAKQVELQIRRMIHGKAKGHR